MTRFEFYAFVAGVLAVLATAPPSWSGEVVTRTLQFDPAELRWEPSASGFKAKLTGESNWSEPGQADVPAVPLNILLPQGTRLASVRVLQAQTLESEPPGRVALNPAPPGFQADGPESPQALLVRGPGGWLRGERIEGMTLFPLVQSNGEWSFAKTVTLEFELESDSRGDSIRPLRGARGDSSRLPGRVLDLRPAGLLPPNLLESNSAGGRFEPRFRPSLDGSPVRMVIIVPAEYTAAFDPLARWRTQTGAPAVIRTLEWISEAYPGGVDQAEKIRLFLQDALMNWGIEFALLGGDADLFPLRYGSTVFFGGATIPTDMYFACLDGSWNEDGDHLWGEGAPGQDDSDLYPDISVGRMPFRDFAEAESMVAKTIGFEQGASGGTEYPNSALLLAEVLFPLEYPSGNVIYLDGADLAESIAVKMEPHITVDRMYENWEPYAGARLEDLPDVIDALNTGYGFVHHVGHGSYTGMAMGYQNKTLKRSDADVLSNGSRTFLLYSVNCTSAALDFDSIGKRFLQNPNGGAVALVGSTEYEFPVTGDLFHQEYYRLLFEGGLVHPAVAISLAKVAQVPNSGYDSSHRWTQFAINYLGDPALRAWVREPSLLAVEHPQTIPAGSAQVEVVVSEPGGAPLSGITVSLTDDSGFVSLAVTNELGEAQLTASGLGPGTAWITASADHFEPQQDSVAVSAGDALAAIIPAGIIDGGNGCLEAGETASAVFRLKNAGTENLTGLSVSVAMDTELLDEYDADPESPQLLSAGDSADVVVEVTAALDAGDLNIIPVMLTVTSDQGQWALNSVIRLGAPAVRIYELQVTEISGDGDGIPEAGETVEILPVLANEGSGSALGVRVELSSAGTDLTEVLADTAGYGTVAPGELGEPGGALSAALGDDPRFSLKVMHSPRPGIELADSEYSLDIVPPEVPGAVGTQTTATSITLTWEPSTSPDLRQYVVYRSAFEEGPYERLNGVSGHPQAVFEDPGLPEFSGFYYRIAAQDSSGNLSVLTAPLRAVTGLSTLPGFPLPNGQETITSATVADLDGDGVPEFITGGDEIYVLRADGSEYIDGDADLRTVGVFSRTNLARGFWAAPAAADLDLDGRPEVVAVSFQEGLVYVWDSAGALRSGWPKSTGSPDASWVYSAPTLLDVTGDGRLEIFLHSEFSLYGFDADGNEVIDGDNDPQTHGVFYKTGSRFSYSSPAGQDLDGDGKAEIVMATRSGDLYVFDDDGSIMAGFPVSYGHDITSSPALADLNGDELPEILFAVRDSLIFEVLQLDGTPLPGWPKAVLVNQDYDCSPAVADVDNDGDLEVAFITGKSELFLWHHDGTLVSGFPVKFLDTTGSEYVARGSPAIANLDEDDDLEIVVTNNSGWVYGVNPDGSPVIGFPIRLSGGIEGGVCIRDIDQDQDNELIVVGLNASIHVFNTAGHVTVNEGWPMFQRNSRRDGSLLTEIEPAKTPVFSLSVLQSPQLPGFADVFAVSSRHLSGEPQLLLNAESLELETVNPGTLYRGLVKLSPGDYSLQIQGNSVDGFSGSAERSFSVLSPNSGAPGSWLSAQGVSVSMPAGGILLVVQRRPQAAPESCTDCLTWSIGPSGEQAALGTKLRFPIPSGWNQVQAEVRHDGVWVPLEGRTTPEGLLVEPTHWGWHRLRNGAAVDAPPAFSVLSSGPNPFVSELAIQFQVDRPAHVRAAVFDVQGRRVRELYDAATPAGPHRVVWNGLDNQGRPAAPGVYFLRLSSGEATAVRKVIRIQGGGQ